MLLFFHSNPLCHVCLPLKLTHWAFYKLASWGSCDMPPLSLPPVGNVYHEHIPSTNGKRWPSGSPPLLLLSVNYLWLLSSLPFHHIRCSQNQYLSLKRVVNISTPLQVLCEQCWIILPGALFLMCCFLVVVPLRPAPTPPVAWWGVPAHSSRRLLLFMFVSSSKTISYHCILPKLLENKQ